MGLKFGSHWDPGPYVGGAPDQLFSVFFFLFFVRKVGPLLNTMTQIRRVFGFGGGLPWGPHKTSTPPLGQILGTCLAVRASGYQLPITM